MTRLGATDPQLPLSKGRIDLLTTPLHHLLEEVEEMKDHERAQQCVAGTCLRNS